MSLDIVCMGEPMLEFSQTTGANHYLPGHGGDTSNCAIAAARQGARTGYFTAVGEDAFGDSFFELWQREGVDTTAVLRDPSAPTGIYFITHDHTGHRFSYYRTGSAASRMTPQQLPHEYIAKARILHLSGISQGISDGACDAAYAAIDSARAAGVTVSYDTNLRLRLWPIARARAVIHQAVSFCDIVLPGLEDAIQLTGLQEPDAIVDFYLRLGADTVALTLGAEGVVVATENQRQHIGGHSVEAVDATGAGDTFDGAFLAQIVAGHDPFGAAVYANAAAALSTTGHGAVGPIPRRPAVTAFLQQADGSAT